MVKKCLICGETAQFKIKDTLDFYCQDCAEENFGDLAALQKIEEDAHILKKYIKEKLDGNIPND